ncbi:MAG: hypothetical protein HOV76_06290 [Hamadaea sp.]|nr:hypothetical protein [Hamadaea sp.]
MTAFPPAFVAAVDAVLQAYEQEIAGLESRTDEAVWVAVERIALALNDVDLVFGIHIETKHQAAESQVEFLAG